MSNETDLLLLTPEEAARRLSMGRTKIYELIAFAEIESVQIGKLRRIPIEALHDYVNRIRTQASAGAA